MREIGLTDWAVGVVWWRDCFIYDRNVVLHTLVQAEQSCAEN